MNLAARTSPRRPWRSHALEASAATLAPSSPLKNLRAALRSSRPTSAWSSTLRRGQSRTTNARYPGTAQQGFPASTSRSSRGARPRGPTLPSVSSRLSASTSARRPGASRVNSRGPSAATRFEPTYSDLKPTDEHDGDVPSPSNTSRQLPDASTASTAPDAHSAHPSSPSRRPNPRLRTSSSRSPAAFTRTGRDATTARVRCPTRIRRHCRRRRRDASPAGAAAAAAARPNA